jgi:hypothetical protein
MLDFDANNNSVAGGNFDSDEMSEEEAHHPNKVLVVS